MKMAETAPPAASATSKATSRDFLTEKRAKERNEMVFVAGW